MKVGLDNQFRGGEEAKLRQKCAQLAAPNLAEKAYREAYPIL